MLETSQLKKNEIKICLFKDFLHGLLKVSYLKRKIIIKSDTIIHSAQDIRIISYRLNGNYEATALYKLTLENNSFGMFLMVQCLRLCLPMQRLRV